MNSGSLATRTNLRIPPIPFGCVCPFIILVCFYDMLLYSGCMYECNCIKHMHVYMSNGICSENREGGD